MMSNVVIHQIFLLARDWFIKRITWSNIPSLTILPAFTPQDYYNKSARFFKERMIATLNCYSNLYSLGYSFYF